MDHWRLLCTIRLAQTQRRYGELRHHLHPRSPQWWPLRLPSHLHHSHHRGHQRCDLFPRNGGGGRPRANLRNACVRACLPVGHARGSAWLASLRCASTHDRGLPAWRRSLRRAWSSDLRLGDAVTPSPGSQRSPQWLLGAEPQLRLGDVPQSRGSSQWLPVQRPLPRRRLPATAHIRVDEAARDHSPHEAWRRRLKQGRRRATAWTPAAVTTVSNRSGEKEDGGG